MTYEQQRVRRILARNTLLFFVTFAVLFSLFGVLVFQLVSDNVYRSADEQLGVVQDVAAATTAPSALSSEENVEQGVSSEAAVAVPSTALDTTQSGTESPQAFYDIDEQYVASNPQIIYLLRDAAGNVAGTEGLYATYPTYFNEVPFDINSLNATYEVTAGGHAYRGINYMLGAAEGEDASTAPLYMQALVNIDSEIALLDHFTKMLVIYLVAAVVIAAAVSYLLSRKTIKPIVASMNRQTQFVQNASHELRTPLAIIRATQERLLAAPSSRVVDKFEEVSAAVDETKRLSRLVDDLMTLSMTDATMVAVDEVEPLDVGSVVRDVTERYADLLEIGGKTLVVEAARVCEARIEGDALRQVVGILLDNALKYTQEGDTVEVRCEERAGRVRVMVADTGCGIAPEDRDRVFERFYRAEVSRTTPGSGLGLSIARALVERFRGTIGVEENNPRGTIVTATFPLVRPR